jgi:chorismate mutase/prephenate dehydrogenase
MTDLEALRNEILAIDGELIRLVSKRVDVATRIGRIKDEEGLPLQNFAVEKNVLEHALTTAQEEGVEEGAVRGIVENLVRAALHAQERARVRSSSGQGKSALVVGGAGLMGEWFARFLNEKGFTVHVIDPRPSPWPAGDPEATEYDVAVVATPPSELAGVLAVLVPRLSAKTLVVDIASVKGPAAGTLRSLAADGHRVASLHPMFGPATELLMNKNVLVLDCGNAEAAQAAARLFEDTTAAVHTMPLGEHDARMAAVLGLAHAVSLVFNQTLTATPFSWGDLRPFASTTFRKQADVSREVAQENPRLYFEIQTLNPENAAMMATLAGSMDHVRRVVEEADAKAFAAMMARARAYYAEEPPS